MLPLINSAHASSPVAIGVIAEVLWYATMLACLPFLTGGIVTLFLKPNTKLRRNFSFIMGILNILIGVGTIGYWIFARALWIIPFFIPLCLGIYIIYQIYQDNSIIRE